MKNIILLLIFLLLIRCNKEDLKPDYSGFLNINEQGINGDMDGNPFNWKFSWGIGFNESYGLAIGPSIPNNLDENERFLTYSLIDQNSSIIYSPDFCNTEDTYEINNGMDISSPKYNLISGDILSSALEIGRKNIGNLENAFNITLYLDSKKYCVRDYYDGIQILKTERIEDEYSNYILAWLALDEIVLDSNIDNSSITISNGKIIAKFLDFP